MFSSLFSFMTMLIPPSLVSFMHQGGSVLWWLAGVVLVCWLLIIERVLFLSFSYPQQKRDWLLQWKKRLEYDSWYAIAQKEGILQQAHLALTKHLDFIKVLVSLCPMLGLLGTVVGMIQIFDLMAASSSNDPKLMASGISMATLPTMAGMVAALTGLFAHSRLAKVIHRKSLYLEQELRSGE